MHKRTNNIIARAETGPHPSHSARQLRYVSALGSGSHAAAAAVIAAAAPGSGNQQRPIWVDIGGERVDATTGGLEYEDGEEVSHPPATKLRWLRPLCRATCPDLRAWWECDMHIGTFA